MRAKFWLDLWHKNDIGFHRAEHNTLLLEFWRHLELPPGAPVFVPMCGKSLDMRWFEQHGHPVVGVELAQIAVETYFAEGNETPQKEVVDRFLRYQGSGSTVYQGDFFDLTSPLLADMQGLFDRGALVALPPDMRFRYVDHLLRIVPDGARILLITFEYDQDLVAGPPHAVLPEEVESLYGNRCDVQYLESIVTSTLPAHFEERGVPHAAESVYLITKRD
jgi:thiopurine S-methyltransferase